MISVIHDISHAGDDRGEVTVLVLRDLIAAFDTVDRRMLLDALHCHFVVNDTPLL